MQTFSAVPPHLMFWCILLTNLQPFSIFRKTSFTNDLGTVVGTNKCSEAYLNDTYVLIVLQILSITVALCKYKLKVSHINCKIKLLTKCTFKNWTWHYSTFSIRNIRYFKFNNWSTRLLIVNASLTEKCTLTDLKRFSKFV